MYKRKAVNEKEHIIKIAETNHGIVTSQAVRNSGIARRALSELCEDGKLIRVQRGVYTTEDAWANEFVLCQYRFPNGIFSHETALYLHGYSDRTPERFAMSFPYGENVSRIKQAGIKPFVLRNHYELGEEAVSTSGGHVVSVYSIERTLIDILKPGGQTDIQLIAPAYKQYVKMPKRDIPLLIEYAETFKMKDKVMSYLEVLL